MNLNDVILQIRNYCPSFGGPDIGRVVGAADFLDGVETTATMGSKDGKLLTQAYVYPLGAVAGEPQGMGASLKQILTESFGVCVMFDNTQDRRGQDAMLLAQEMRAELYSAIYNWRTETSHAARAIFAVRDRNVSMDRARVMWEYEFALYVSVTYVDGFPLVTFPLTQISLTNTGTGGDALGNGMTVQEELP